MNPNIKDFLKDVVKNGNPSDCVFQLVDTYYRIIREECIVNKEQKNNELQDYYPDEFLVPVLERDSGIGIALLQLLDAGFDIDGSDGYFNALMLAVGEADAQMTDFLIAHDSDPTSWPCDDEKPKFAHGNFYLEDIDINYHSETENAKYIDGLYRTALVLAKDSRLRPFHGLCLGIDENGNVSFSPPRCKY